MKKRIFVVIVTFIVAFTYAQDEKSEKDLYKHWSIELNVGMGKKNEYKISIVELVGGKIYMVHNVKN